VILRAARNTPLSTVIIALILQTANVAANDNENYHANPNIKDVQLKVDESFTQARARLVNSGWQPTRMHQGDNYDYDGAEKELVDRGFLEVDFCSTDAGALCVLYYSKAGECLRLTTRGEQIHFMHITGWRANVRPEAISPDGTSRCLN
jgi:hypothetical protein